MNLSVRAHYLFMVLADKSKVLDHCMNKLFLSYT